MRDEMAFGINREDLIEWKTQVKNGKIAFITHYWYDPRFPKSRCVTKVGCSDIPKLIKWGSKYGLEPRWIDDRSDFPHFDLMGERQYAILKQEGYEDTIKKFNLHA